MTEVNSSTTEPLVPEEFSKGDVKDLGSILEALDREMGFFRKRAGEVFFFGLLVEVLILAGKEKIILPEGRSLLNASVHSFLFIAVAVIGIALGAEYRRRIRKLKFSRLTVLEKRGFKRIYPTDEDQALSEIQVLYVVLVFLSSGGIVLVWLNLVSREGSSTLSWVGLLLGTLGLLGAALYLLSRIGRWFVRYLARRRSSANT